MKFFSKENKILLKEMVKTDFKLRYQGSLIGHLWSILKPLMLFTIMYLVFIRFLRLDDGTPHYAIWGTSRYGDMVILPRSYKYGNGVHCYSWRFIT